MAGVVSQDRGPTGASIDLQALRESIDREMDHECFVARLQVARFSADDILDIELSYNLAKFGHHEQFRESGEPYFEHPRAVAVQLIEIRTALLEGGREAEALAGVTKDGIILALHHDTVEDTKLFGGAGLRGPFAKEISAFRLLWAYGVDVMCGIEALTKVEAGDHGISPAEAKLASVEKVTASDPMTRRVKQSDRLHNLRTLGATPPAKQRRIVRATVEQYIPSWDRDARGDDSGRVVSQILLDLVNETIEELRASWLGQDESKLSPEPASEPVPIDLERATAYEILDGIPGLTIVERQLVHFAYDIAAYGHTSTEDAGQDGELSFEQIKGATFDLIDEMTKRNSHDWKLIAASLLRDTVEHTYIFGSDSIAGMRYDQVAARNIGKVFGSEVRHLVLSQTRQEPGPRAGATESTYLESLQGAGPAAVVLQMTDTVERLKRINDVPGDEQSSFIEHLERDYMPMFEVFSERDGRLQELIGRYLHKIQTQKRGVEQARNG
ncbi:MAG: hypothetical protein P8R42_09780 [Candidatus Binatia bacterium]|nr:hypothetical protein [Candidatus Binatia bacterium]